MIKIKDLAIILVASFLLVMYLEWGAKHTAQSEPTDFDKTIEYPALDSLTGWTLSSKKNSPSGHIFIPSQYENPKTIMITGGSTSDVNFDNQSWPIFLQKSLDQSPPGVQIYAGSVAGHNSHQELLKIIRDTRALKPDLVISYTGANESVENHNPHPFTRFHTQHFYQNSMMPIKMLPGLSKVITDMVSSTSFEFGPKDTTTPEDAFLLNLKSAQAITKLQGIEYLVILQPFLSSGERTLSQKEKALLENPIFEKIVNENKQYYENIIIQSTNDELNFIIDGRNFLKGLDDVFYDDCHIYTPGNLLIAEHLEKIIRNTDLFENPN